jgi:hypothetical protein
MSMLHSVAKSLIKSARKESEQDRSKSMMIGVKSPFARRKKVEPPRHIKELIQDIV